MLEYKPKKPLGKRLLTVFLLQYFCYITEWFICIA